MERLLNILWGGIWLGSVYATLAVAMVLSYRAARVVNMATGAIFVFAALLYAKLQSSGVPTGVAASCAVVVAVVLAVAQEAFVLRPIAGSAPQILLLGTLAVAIVLSGVSAVLFGRDPITGAGLASNRALKIGFWHTNYNAIILVVAVIAVVTVSWRLFEISRTGKAITAIGADPGAAKLLGIGVWRWRMFAAAVLGMLAGVSGVLFLPLGVLDFSQGLSFTLYGFVVAAIAGYYSIPLSLLAGWGFGVVSSVGTAYVSSVFSQAVTFGILALVVLVGQYVNRRSVFS